MSDIDKDIIRLPHAKLVDGHNRHVNYLRISITDRCNLQCMYCRPHDLIPKLRHKEILRYEEILRLVRISSHLGISKIRITGGEPLVRKGVYDFLKELTDIDGILDVSLTTNGVLLKDNIKKLQSTGIKRINVSIDTLDKEKFANITGHNLFQQVWEGIVLAHDMGFHPIKLNIVALKGINDDDLTDFARLSFSYPFHIRFIEYMPIGNARTDTGQRMLASEIKKKIEVLGKLVPVEKEINDGPAERYKLLDAKGEIGFIQPISNHFCNQCNRLRLTASGQLRTCLLSDHQEDIKESLRKGFSDSKLADILMKAVYRKPLGHNLACHKPDKILGQMSAIGG